MSDVVVDITVAGYDILGARQELKRILRDYCIQEWIATYTLRETNTLRGFRFRVTFASDVSGFCEAEIWNRDTVKGGE